MRYYDKELFEAVAANISSNFTKFETDQLLKVLVPRPAPELSTY